MERENYGMFLDTIKITLECLNAETVEFIPEVGVVAQSIWSTHELMQIKEQLKGLLKLVPGPKFFINND